MGTLIVVVALVSDVQTLMMQRYRVEVWMQCSQTDDSRSGHWLAHSGHGPSA